MSQPREIGADEYVSQYGSRLTGEPVFWDHLKPADIDGLSAIIGQVTPAEGRRRVRGPRSGPPTRDDGIRYALVADLEKEGFRVTDTGWPGNTKHVSISYPGEWDDTVAGKFNKCFGAPLWHEEAKQGGPP